MAWYNPFSWGERKASILTKEVYDPAKQAVSSPLSQFLSEKVGTGLPEYEGTLAAPLDEATMSRYSEFMAMPAGEWYDKAVAEPETRRFKEEFLPELREGYAGGLRGSGRYYGEEEAMTKFSEALAQGRYQAMREIPQEQFKMGMTKAAYEDIKVQREYQDWYKSLPEISPVITQSLQFLSEQTSTGKTVLSGLDPGQEGWFADLLGMGIQAAATYFGATAIAAAL